MDPDLNNYDLNHITTDHPTMTREEWLGAFRTAWRSFQDQQAPVSSDVHSTITKELGRHRRERHRVDAQPGVRKVTARDKLWCRATHRV
jgi:hypothetical protein